MFRQFIITGTIGIIGGKRKRRGHVRSYFDFPNFLFQFFQNFRQVSALVKRKSLESLPGNKITVVDLVHFPYVHNELIKFPIMVNHCI